MLFKKQVQRMCLRWQTWLALLIGLAIVVMQAKTINPINATRGVNNAFLHLTGFDFTGAGTTNYYLLLPLMCGLAASSTFQEDRQSHRLTELLTKRNLRQYLLSTSASSFFVGGVVGILPLLVEASYFFTKYNVANLPTGRDFRIIDPSGWGYGLAMHNTLLFWLCTILIAFVFSGLFSLIGLVASYYNLRRGVEAVIPFVLSFLTVLVASLSGEVEGSIYYLLTPTYSNNYFYDLYLLAAYFVVITGAVCLLTWRRGRQDVFN